MDQPGAIVGAGEGGDRILVGLEFGISADLDYGISLDRDFLFVLYCV